MSTTSEEVRSEVEFECFGCGELFKEEPQYTGECPYCQSGLISLAEGEDTTSVTGR